MENNPLNMLTSKIVLLKNIVQKDNYTFTITWSDSTEDDFKLFELQSQCPCASCVDEVTGKRKHTTPPIPFDVQASKIENVGRYALRITFTSGCSRGIYSFEYLRSLKRHL